MYRIDVRASRCKINLRLLITWTDLTDRQTGIFVILFSIKRNCIKKFPENSDRLTEDGLNPLVPPTYFQGFQPPGSMPLVNGYYSITSYRTKLLGRCLLSFVRVATRTVVCHRFG